MQGADGILGANADQLRVLAQQFDQGAQRLDSNRLNVLSLLQSVFWEGPTSARFRLQWNAQHGRQIQQAAEMLRESARKLRANADAQERASAAEGISMSGSGEDRVSAGAGAPGGVSPRVLYDFLGSVISAGSTVSDIREIKRGGPVV